MRALLVKYNLQGCRSADIDGGGAPPEALERIAALVETVNTVHSKALRMEGPNVFNVVSPSVERSVYILNSLRICQTSMPYGSSRRQLLGGGVQFRHASALSAHFMGVART